MYYYPIDILTHHHKYQPREMLKFFLSPLDLIKLDSHKDILHCQKKLLLPIIDKTPTTCEEDKKLAYAIL